MAASTDLDATEIVKKLGEMWRELPANEKKVRLLHSLYDMRRGLTFNAGL